jgi:hypothetical protein
MGLSSQRRKKKKQDNSIRCHPPVNRDLRQAGGWIKISYPDKGIVDIRSQLVLFKRADIRVQGFRGSRVRVKILRTKQPTLDPLTP